MWSFLLGHIMRLLVPKASWKVEFHTKFSDFLFAMLLFFRSTKHNHVKDNIFAKYLCIRTFGKMKLEEFKNLISVADYKVCASKIKKNPTWYPLTLDIFVKFLYKVIFFYVYVFSLYFFSFAYILFVCLF